MTASGRLSLGAAACVLACLAAADALADRGRPVPPLHLAAS